jgi:transposase
MISVKNQKGEQGKNRLLSDGAWTSVALSLPVATEEALQRTYDKRTVCNSRGWVVRARAPWRNGAQDLPQLKAGGLGSPGAWPVRAAAPSRKTPRPTLGSTGPMTVASLGYLLAWQVTAAHAPARAQVECLTGRVQDVTGESVV